MLVTSRRRLTALDDATAISLDILPPDQAAALLVRLAGRAGLRPADPPVGEITRLCGYLPLAAIAVAVLYGPWLARASAAVDLALLVFVGHIFAGLGQLQVSAVGHVTALATGAVLGGAVTCRRHGQRRALRQDTPPRPMA